MKIKLGGCAIKNSKGEILLIHRNTEKRKQWELPGGKLELNENAEDAAKRELKEELDVDIAIIKRLGQATFEDNGISFDYTWFDAKIISGTPRLMEKGFDNLDFFSEEKLKKFYNELSINVKNFLRTVKI